MNEAGSGGRPPERGRQDVTDDEVLEWWRGLRTQSRWALTQFFRTLPVEGMPAALGIQKLENADEVDCYFMPDITLDTSRSYRRRKAQ